MFVIGDLQKYFTYSFQGHAHKRDSYSNEQNSVGHSSSRTKNKKTKKNNKHIYNCYKKPHFSRLCLMPTAYY